MTRVLKGKAVYVGRKRYSVGDELPERIASRIQAEKKPVHPKPVKKAEETKTE